jgi:hypothetical protein
MFLKLKPVFRALSWRRTLRKKRKPAVLSRFLPSVSGNTDTKGKAGGSLRGFQKLSSRRRTFSLKGRVKENCPAIYENPAVAGGRILFFSKAVLFFQPVKDIFGDEMAQNDRNG